ncbi:MAG TPA: zf-HC2 domain-containing protein [Blastocatellia bacterium]|nr:zf-HC2 domain-containing protein [Blastocatellia bacterium]
MNCQKYEQLIALYVEGDLAERESAKVASHLTLCEPCHQFADDLRESQHALRAARADEFSEAMLADLRRSVMSEITLRPAANGFWSQFFRPLRWQYATLVAVLVLLAGSGAWLYFKPNGTSPPIAKRRPERTGGNSGGKAQQEPLPQNDTARVNSAPRHRSRSAAPKRKAEAVPDLIASSGEQPVPAPALPPAVPVTELGVDQSSLVKGLTMLQSEPLAGPDTENDSQLPSDVAPVATKAAPPSDDNKVRMEIQTRDPNVRIIWFVNREPRRADTE